jgi:hypothetical protein
MGLCLETWKALLVDLETVPDDEFGMSVVLSHKASGVPLEHGEKIPACGTVACMAGRIVAMYADSVPVDPFEFAGEKLGVPASRSTYVFIGSWSGKPMRAVTRQETIEYVKHVIATEQIFYSRGDL